MIRRVTLKRFKRFIDETFEIPGHLVLAGPNNAGKTTLLQAIATWSFALEKWRELNHFRRHGPRASYPKQPITRQAFPAVPLRSFELLWEGRTYQGNIEICVEMSDGQRVTMLLESDSTEQVYVRPDSGSEPEVLRTIPLGQVFVPAMGGLGIDEPVLQPPRIRHLLGQGRPSEVLRNLLVEASESTSWPDLVDAIQRLFGFSLLKPDSTGHNIVAEYKQTPKGPSFDIASAGSGFLQVLMLLTFLHTRPGAVLLVDEPDAHLHLVLQDAIYGELQRVAATKDSQLILATHSEIIINSVDPSELCVLLDKPRILGSIAERTELVAALGVLTSADLMQALEMPGVLYLEGSTDLMILRELAMTLQHKAGALLTTQLFWRPTNNQLREDGKGVKARDHYDALQVAKPGLPGLELVDGDGQAGKQSTPITGQGFQKLRWARYEIESYLFHPTALARFVEKQLGPGAAEQGIKDLNAYLTDNLPPAVVKDPLGDHVFLKNTKARTEILPPALAAAGLPGFPYTRFHEIAAIMLPEEIHPEVTEKLTLLCKAFNQ